MGTPKKGQEGRADPPWGEKTSLAKKVGGERGNIGQAKIGSKREKEREQLMEPEETVTALKIFRRKRRKREELGVRRVGRAGRERGGELKRRREGGGEVVWGGRMCRCAKREERGGVCGATAGLRCGEANPNQWDGVEPSHWGGPQG